MTLQVGFTGNISAMIQKRIADGSLVLPTLPDVVITAEKMLQDKKGDISKVSTLIERDPMLTAQVLSLANSAAFARQQRAESIRQAIAYLGDSNLRKLLLTATSRQLFSSHVPRVNDTLKALWNHSLAVAVYSQDLAGLTQTGDPEAAYVAGLLHDVGQTVVAVFLVRFWPAIGKPGKSGFLSRTGSRLSRKSTAPSASRSPRNGTCRKRSAKQSKNVTITIPRRVTQSPISFGFLTRSPNKTDFASPR
jgi:HDOD domain